MEQARDFVAECDALYSALANVDDAAWTTATQFKHWTFDDVLVHLHFWNDMAHLSLIDPDAFDTRLGLVREGIETGNLRVVENKLIELRGPALRDAWQTLYRDIGRHWPTSIRRRA